MESLIRKTTLAILALLVTLGVAANAFGQSYPTKSIKLLIPYPPGGVFDALFRPLALLMTESMGQPIVIDNRPGGNTIIGMDLCAKSAPDGYTICATSNDSMSLNPHLYSKLPYDTSKDFVGISNLLYIDEVIVAHPSAPFNTFREMIDQAKKTPGKLNFASTGKGSMSHLSSELFKQSAGLDIVHVPYSGAAPAINDLLGGHVQMLFADMQVLLGSVQSGQLRAMAIGGRARSAPLPDVPTTGEMGLPQVEASNWYGAVAPPGIPTAIADKLTRVMIEAMRSPEVRDKLVPQGAEIVANTPEEFATFVKAETEKWAKVINAAGIKAN